MYFAAERPSGNAYKFNLRRGDKVIISITGEGEFRDRIFADLWLQKPDTSWQIICFKDSLNTIIQDIEKDGYYLLRIHPELLVTGTYLLSIQTKASFGFPVQTNYHTSIESYWGDPRDNGVRRHEGVDIFGKFRTPVVAAASGQVTSVSEAGLGGKVIFLRPSEKNYTLYYAHLDSQIAKQGEWITVGQLIGLMGNTGNAKTTATHLHFGVYASDGAVDPMPFIDNNKPKLIRIKAPAQLLDQWLYAGSRITVRERPDNRSPVLPN